MRLNEKVKQDLDRLNTGLLPGVAEWDDVKMAELYSEFADEDLALAEAGMSDYVLGLAQEDAGNWHIIA